MSEEIAKKFAKKFPQKNSKIFACKIFKPFLKTFSMQVPNELSNTFLKKLSQEMAKSITGEITKKLQKELGIDFSKFRLQGIFKGAGDGILYCIVFDKEIPRAI